MADIVIINPRFDISFWGMEHCMRMFGKRANLPVACLGLLAALVPDHHQVTLLDENVEDIDFDRLGRADLVAITGMSIQGWRMIEIIEEVKSRGVITVVGGAMATVEPEILEGLADVIFVGEAEETWPQFLRGVGAGLAQAPLRAGREDRHVHVAATPRRSAESRALHVRQPPDFARLSVPVRVLRHHRHLRPEAAAQDAPSRSSPSSRHLRAGLRMLFVVDDNLIGNKKAIKAILRDIVSWQQEHGYPLAFFTEASLDLAEDDELMELLVAANFRASSSASRAPNEESLQRDQETSERAAERWNLA